MDNTNQSRARAFTLAAGVTVDILYDAEGMDTQTTDDLEVAIQNTGANPIEFVTRIQVLDSLSYTDPVNYGPIPPGVLWRFTFPNVGDALTRLQAMSVNASTLTIETRAIQR